MVIDGGWTDMLEMIWHGAAMGVGATACFDLSERTLSLVGLQPRPDWRPAGRWFWHLLRHGRVFHPDFSRVAPYPHELILGWSGHYVVGAGLGVIFSFCVGSGWLSAPTILPAWAFGIANIAAAWLLLFPGMGMGWFASRTPSPFRARILGLVSHSFFGFGLYATGLILSLGAG